MSKPYCDCPCPECICPPWNHCGCREWQPEECPGATFNCNHIPVEDDEDDDDYYDPDDDGDYRGQFRDENF